MAHNPCEARRQDNRIDKQTRMNKQMSDRHECLSQNYEL